MSRNFSLYTQRQYNFRITIKIIVLLVCFNAYSSFSQPIPKECLLNDFIFNQNFAKQNNEAFISGNYKTVIVKKIKQDFSFGIWTEPQVQSIDTFTYQIFKNNCWIVYYSQNGNYFETSTYKFDGDTIIQNLDCYNRAFNQTNKTNSYIIASFNNTPVYHFTQNSPMNTGYSYRNTFNLDGKLLLEQSYNMGMVSDLCKHIYKDTIEFLERYNKSELTSRMEYIYAKNGNLLFKNKFKESGEKINYRKYIYDKKGRILTEYDYENSYQVGMFQKPIDRTYQYSNNAINVIVNNSPPKFKYYATFTLGEKGNILKAEKVDHYAKYNAEFSYTNSPFLPVKVVYYEQIHGFNQVKNELLIEYIK